SVPAGPAPGGYCKVVGSNYKVGSNVTVAEVIPSQSQVISIVTAPNTYVPNLTTGSVTMNIGAGVNEATYTDVKNAGPTLRNSGYLEVCKTVAETVPTPVFSFQISQIGSTTQTVAVPAGACSPAVNVLSGTVSVKELVPTGWKQSACSTLPAARLVSCTLATNTASVTVPAGGVGSETIVNITDTPCRSFTATTVAGSATVTSATGNFTAADIGKTISGPGIPAGTTITARASVTTIAISHPATTTGVVTLYIC
ncbi:MAG: conserved repeat domain, partial [Acidimicrobiales bacterium]|nr:conserved repeat domain [Acidimicrobiales bacterium]